MTSPIASKFVRILLACSVFVGQQPVFAEPAPAPAQTFDLGSAARSQQAQNGGAIMVGGARVIVRPGQALTPGEFAAMRQVATTGHQDLMLAASGAAVGGRVNVDSLLQGLGNLVVPNGVSAVANFSSTSLLNISGNLVNNGNIYALASGTARGAGTIGATNVFNNASGVISSVLPPALAAKFGAAPIFDLSLNAIGDIVNAGTISSSGLLTLSAGGGTIRNAGLITAEHGNVAVSDAMRNVVFDNTGGVVRAENGCINVHSTQFAGNGNISLFGGDWVSQNVNLNAGGGDILVAVEKISGALNTQAGTQHVLTNTPNLVLGSNIITGDPTFVNAGGNIVINGTVGTGAEDIAIIAKGNITAGPNGEVVNHGFNVTLIAGAFVTVNGGTTGGQPGTDAVKLNNGSTVGVNFTAGTGGNIDLSGSTKQFVIDTSGVIDNVGLNANVDGGDILLAAYASGTTGGGIFTNTGANMGGIRSSGGHNSNYGGNGGNITVIAGGNPSTPGETVRLNAVLSGVDGTDDGVKGGNIYIVTAQPMGSNPSTPVVLFDSHGAVDAASFSQVTFTPTFQLNYVPLVRPNAQMHFFGPIQSAPLAGGPGGAGGIAGSDGEDGVSGADAGMITIYSGHSITATVINSSGGGGGGGGGGVGGTDGTLGRNGGSGGLGGNAGDLFISSALGNITANTITASGGAGGGGGGGGGAGINSTLQGFGRDGGRGGDAGQLTVQAGGTVNVQKLLSSGGADGGFGGDGGIDDLNGTPTFAGGGGGGGGGGASGGGQSSQGGGGGGGGQGRTSTIEAAGGAGGGGGFVGAGGVGTSVAGGGGVGSQFGVTGGTGGARGNGPSGPNPFPGVDGDAGLALGAGSGVDETPAVQLYGGTPDPKYLQGADYGNTGNGVAPAITPRAEGSNINIGTSIPLYSSPDFGQDGNGNAQGELFIEISGGLTGVIGSTSMVNAAEWVAVNQVKYTGSTSNYAGQTLVLGGSLADGDVNGYAVGGSFITAPANMPTGGVFFGYTLPLNVTNNVSATELHTDGVTTVNGTLSFTNPAGGTLFTDLVRVGDAPGTGSAKITGTGAFLTIQGNTFEDVEVTNNATISHSKVINVLSAPGESVDVNGMNGRYESPITNVTAQDGISFLTTGPTVLRFTGELKLSPGAGKDISIGTLGVTSITAAKFTYAAGTISGDIRNFHTTGATGSYNFESGGTIANPDGDIVLPANITTGGDLALLASGNIIGGKGFTKINATSKTASGSNITMVAGFDFDGEASLNTVSDGVYNNFTASTTGGSIYLPKVAIDTSTKVANQSGGKVTLIARSGAQNAGTIYLGAINTTGTSSGGVVTITAGGGMNIGGITTTGALGGSVTLLGAQPTAAGVSVTNGLLSGTFGNNGVSASNGAAVIVNGAILTGGSANASLTSSDLKVAADAQISVSKGINTAGGAKGTAAGVGGGDVTLDSLNSISVLGTGIITSGGAFKGDSASGGKAGDIQIGTLNKPTSVSLSSLIAKGGNNGGTGGAGPGGSVVITTAQDGFAHYVAPVTLSGFIDTRGGAETATAPVAGGSGGPVSINAGLLAIKGSTSGASIISSGGAGSLGAAAGNGGQINIDTYAVQQLPSNFDLTSTKASIPVLAGGLFTVNAGAPVNGTAGKIVSVGSVSSKTFVNASNPLPATTGVNVVVHGSALSITDSTGATPTFPIADTAFKRTLVTPAQAVALFQASQKSGATNNTLRPNLTGAAASGAVALTDGDVNGVKFTAFKLVNGTSVTVSGTLPTLNLTGGVSIPANTTLAVNGTKFGFIDLGTGALSIAETGILSSTGTLVLGSGSASWTNAGTISATNIGIARPSTAALTVNFGPNASTIGSFLMGSSLDAAVNVKFLAPKATATRNVNLALGSLPMPTQFLAISTGIAGVANTRPTDSISFGFGGTGTVSGALSAASITIAGTSNKIGTATTPTSVTIADNTSLTADSKLSVATTGTLQIGSTAAGATGVSLTAGKLNPNGTSAIDFSNGAVLAKGDLLTAGTFTLLSTGPGGIVIGNAASGNTQPNFLENGTKLSITATAGDITIGNNNLFRAMGGNVVMLAKGNLTGGTANQFQAAGDGTTATGGIELGAGTTTSSIARLFSIRANAGTVNGGVVTSANPRYVLLSSGNVNLGGATLDFANKGVATFNGLNGKAVTLNGGAFATTSSKPISDVEGEAVEEFVVDTDSDSDDGEDLALRAQR